MKIIDLEFIENAIVGATLLGCGGGGEPKIGFLMAKQAIETYGPVNLISIEDLNDTDIVGSVSMMGMGSVTAQKFGNGDEFEVVINAFAKYVKMHPKALYAIETGALNTMIPIVAAARMNLDIVDADCAGRAFPELKMITQSIFDIFDSPIALVHEKLDPIIVNAKTYHDMEAYCRAITLAFGGSAMMAECFVPKVVFEKFAVQNSLSRAYEIGKIIRSSTSPLQELISQQNAYHLFDGVIESISNITEGGFSKSVIVFSSNDHNDSYQISVQNENLIAYHNGSVLAMVPDLICILDYKTCYPILNDHLYVGLQVTVIALKCDLKWRSNKGLEIAGPNAFGIETDYQPVESIAKGISE